MQGSAIPYLTLYGEGQEAALFYSDVFRLTQIRVQKYSDANVPHPPEAKDYLLHCQLQRGDFQLMLADTLDPRPTNVRHGISLLVQCESEEEILRYYNGLKQGGTVLLELEDMFWGAKFGKVKDKFGFVWDVNFEK